MPVAEWSIADFARYRVIDIIEETDASAKASPLLVNDYRRALIHITNMVKYKGIVWRDLQEFYQKHSDSGYELLFIHCRDYRDFKDIQAIIPDVLTLLITREGIEPSNEQDAEIPDYEYDIHIKLPPLDSDEYSAMIEWLWRRLVHGEQEEEHGDEESSDN